MFQEGVRLKLESFVNLCEAVPRGECSSFIRVNGVRAFKANRITIANIRAQTPKLYALNLNPKPETPSLSLRSPKPISNAKKLINKFNSKTLNPKPEPLHT